MTTASKILQKLFLPFNASRLYLPVATDHGANGENAQTIERTPAWVAVFSSSVNTARGDSTPCFRETHILPPRFGLELISSSSLGGECSLEHSGPPAHCTLHHPGCQGAEGHSGSTRTFVRV